MLLFDQVLHNNSKMIIKMLISISYSAVDFLYREMASVTHLVDTPFQSKAVELLIENVEVG